MLGGLTGSIQKQGSTEVGPVGRKRDKVALFLNSSITQLCNIYQLYKKSNILLEEIDSSLLDSSITRILY